MMRGACNLQPFRFAVQCFSTFPFQKCLCRGRTHMNPGDFKCLKHGCLSRQRGSVSPDGVWSTYSRMHCGIKKNISGANQSFRVNRTNSNLDHRISIQGTRGDLIMLQLTGCSWIGCKSLSHSPCVPLWMLIWWFRLEFTWFAQTYWFALICFLVWFYQ